MNHDEHDELWELLGKARVPKERPFFAAKVLNALNDTLTQDTAQEPKGLMAWWMALRRQWVVALATCSAVAVAAVVTFGPQTPKSVVTTATGTTVTAVADPLAGLADAIETSDDLVTSLDNLTVAQDNSIWLQAAPSSLY